MSLSGLRTPTQGEQRSPVAALGLSGFCLHPHAAKLHRPNPFCSAQRGRCLCLLSCTAKAKPILPCWAAFLHLPEFTPWIPSSGSAWLLPLSGCACRQVYCGLRFCNSMSIHVHCLVLIATLINTLPADFLYSPMTSTEQKRKMVENLAKEARLKKRTVNFVNLLIDKHRVDAVEDVFAAFEEEYCTLTDTQVWLVSPWAGKVVAFGSGQVW